VPTQAIRPYRSKHKRAVETALINNLKASDEEVCEYIDEEMGVEPLQTWRTTGNERGWVAAYHGPGKARVEKYISVVRRDLRSQGRL
jgi:hypothetical protein